jgi:hypothetical protein
MNGISPSLAASIGSIIGQRVVESMTIGGDPPNGPALRQIDRQALAAPAFLATDDDTGDDPADFADWLDSDAHVTAAAVACMAHGLGIGPVTGHLRANTANSSGFHVPEPADDDLPGALSYAAMLADDVNPSVRDALRRDGRMDSPAALAADLPPAPAGHRLLYHNPQDASADRGTGWDSEFPAAASAFRARLDAVKQVAEVVRNQHWSNPGQPISIGHGPDNDVDLSALMGEEPGWLRDEISEPREAVAGMDDEDDEGDSASSASMSARADGKPIASVVTGGLTGGRW